MMFVKEAATFITALGTPLDQQDNLVEASFRRHIDHQLENDLDGLLVLGSMGQMACVKHSTYAECARVAVDQGPIWARAHKGLAHTQVGILGRD